MLGRIEAGLQRLVQSPVGAVLANAGAATLRGLGLDPQRVLAGLIAGGQDQQVLATGPKGLSVLLMSATSDGGGTQWTRERVAETYLAILRDVLGEDTMEGATEATVFVDDLGLDSTMLIELNMKVEIEYGITVRDEDTANIRTIGQAIDLIFRGVTQQG